MDKYCPNCGKKYKWYEAECPDCHVALTEVPPAGAPTPDITLVTVFQTDELGLLPLAKMALEQEEIEYVVRDERRNPMAAGGRPFRGDAPQTAVEILVRPEEAERARNLLMDLETSGAPRTAPLASSPPPLPGPSSGRETVELFDRDTGALVGRITEDQLQWLSQQLERESDDDEDYYIDRPTLEMLEDAHGDAGLMAFLRKALGEREGVEIRWQRKTS